MDTLPPLGEGLPPHSSLQQIREPPPPLSSITSRGRLHLLSDGDDLAPTPTIRTTLNDCCVTTTTIGPNTTMAGVSSGASATTTASSFLSPPPSPPRFNSCSPGPSTRSVPKMGSMDDSYCERYRSTSSFGWYDETTAFESVDVPHSNKACYQIEDWRTLETWEGGRERRRESQEGVEFEVPNAQVTTNKTFRHANHGRPEPYAVSIGSTRVRRVSPFAVHAEYQVLMSTKDKTYKSWKRFSDFKLLAEYAKISDLRDTVMAWRHIQQTQRWFRCLEANYLKTKCRLLEKFLAQLLFDVPTPSLLMNFVGAQQPGLVRRR